jgi:hypothetical protein
MRTSCERCANLRHQLIPCPLVPAVNNGPVPSSSANADSNIIASILAA